MQPADGGPPTSWTLRLPRGRRLVLRAGRPQLVGVLNITPDSFSDGGRYLDADAAVAHARTMLDAGADLLDLGAESTRPGGGVYGDGAPDVSVEDECRRLLPVLERLRAQTDAPLSVDTRKPAVARAALAAGADLINDITGLADPAMRALLAEADCPAIVMHARGGLATMQRGIHFDRVVDEVRDELMAATARARDDGVDPAQLIVDPGIGFGKTAAHNLLLLRHLDALAVLGHPLFVGASRKSFIAWLHDPPADAPPDRRLGGSLAAVGWALRAGAALLRVHDVFETAQFVRVWNAIDFADSAAAAAADDDPRR
ncbi:MAG: dihydropteroate synthase [Acidobacteriota bacterium]